MGLHFWYRFCHLIDSRNLIFQAEHLFRLVVVFSLLGWRGAFGFLSCCSGAIDQADSGRLSAFWGPVSFGSNIQVEWIKRRKEWFLVLRNNNLNQCTDRLFFLCNFVIKMF